MKIKIISTLLLMLVSTTAISMEWKANNTNSHQQTMAGLEFIENGEPIGFIGVTFSGNFQCLPSLTVVTKNPYGNNIEKQAYQNKVELEVDGKFIWSTEIVQTRHAGGYDQYYMSLFSKKDKAILNALSSGNIATLTIEGAPPITFPLNGSAQAIKKATKSCLS